jgi:hypothetical protein
MLRAQWRRLADEAVAGGLHWGGNAHHRQVPSYSVDDARAEMAAAASIAL